MNVVALKRAVFAFSGYATSTQGSSDKSNTVQYVPEDVITMDTPPEELLQVGMK